MLSKAIIPLGYQKDTNFDKVHPIQYQNNCVHQLNFNTSCMQVIKRSMQVNTCKCKWNRCKFNSFASSTTWKHLSRSKVAFSCFHMQVIRNPVQFLIYQCNSNEKKRQVICKTANLGTSFIALSASSIYCILIICKKQKAICKSALVKASEMDQVLSKLYTAGRWWQSNDL